MFQKSCELRGRPRKAGQQGPRHDTSPYNSLLSITGALPLLGSSNSLSLVSQALVLPPQPPR